MRTANGQIKTHKAKIRTIFLESRRLLIVISLFYSLSGHTSYSVLRTAYSVKCEMQAPGIDVRHKDPRGTSDRFQVPSGV